MYDSVALLTDALHDRYRVERELGEGGMATVYLADDLRHHRKVAIKVLKPELTELVGTDRFQREIKTTANLQHPHILPLFDSGEANGSLFYVMPFVDGETLRQRLDRESRLSVTEAVRIVTLVAAALQYAHDRGIVHRDVKPENILFASDLPVVSDFGVSLPIQKPDDVRLTESGHSVGTVLYASPEQLLGEPNVDERSDLYALACVLYELLTGKPPHSGASTATIIAKKLTSAPAAVRTVRDNVPDFVEDALTKALSIDPNDRMTSMRAFIDALSVGQARTTAQHALPLGNLPVQSTSLIGRSESIDQVAALLDTTRLITLLGMGGLGKTRMSIEVANHVRRRFPDGTWFVDLAALTDARAVGLAAAGVFGVAQQSGKTIEQSIVDSLGARRLLLVLDNCEHVTTAAAALAHAVLAGCPQVKIIATSREALSISGEHVWQVPALRVSGDAAPAVELFIDRALSVAPGFDASVHREAIGEICKALDGIPLAIELAAARVRSLNPRQILERLSDPLRLLTGGSRAPDRARHQTLRAAVQWSYDLLSPSERAVLARASVFAGGMTLDAAESVCACEDVVVEDVFDVLDSLVSKSLLSVERHTDRVRYGMLETIRSFCTEKLTETGEADNTRHQHAEYFAHQAATYFELWRSPREREAYEWLDLEINNVRVAFRWAMDHEEVDIAARIASAVGDMGRFRLREEAANWAEEIVDAARAVRHRRLTILLTWSASTAWAFSRFDDAKRFGEEAIALRDDPSFDPFVWAYGDLAFVSIFAGNIDGAIELLKTGAAHPTDRHDRFMLAFQLFIMATAGHAAEALEIADDAVRTVEAAGVPMSIAVAYGAKGAALEATDPDAALSAYERGIEVARDAGCRFMETLIAPRLAALHARGGDPAAALAGFERMLLSFGEATDIASVSAWRASLVVMLAKLGHHQAAATLHGTFAGKIEAAGVVPEHTAAVEQVRAALGDHAFTSASARGAAMSLRQATDFSIEQVRLGLASLTSPELG
jgi:predicted ATPase